MTKVNVKAKEIVVSKGIAATLEAFVSSYPLGGDFVNLSWKINDVNGNTIDSDTTELGSDVVANWNSDDGVLIDALLKHPRLNLQKA